MSDQLTMPCPTCGTSAPAGASFCGNCGAALSAAEPVATRQPSAQTPLAAPAAGGISPADSRNWAMGAHLLALAGALIAGLASFVGPLVIWLIRRDDDAFAAQHALEALNFNLMMLGAVVIGGIVGIGTFGFGLILILPALLALGVLWLVWTIQAALAASRGEPYRYPLSIRLIS